MSYESKYVPNTDDRTKAYEDAQGILADCVKHLRVMPFFQIKDHVERQNAKWMIDACVDIAVEYGYCIDRDCRECK